MGSRAHPRSRGENCRVRLGWRAPRGSSPLTRGKQVRHRRWERKLGLIPAHAGKTGRPGSVPGRQTAHPRSRGENYATRRNPANPTGSSPLTRGKQIKQHRKVNSHGLIPAHAGKTRRWARRRRGSRAHPRSRGENAPRSDAWLTRCGSSPLTRGKPVRWSSLAWWLGLIPAHAGKTGRTHDGR